MVCALMAVDYNNEVDECMPCRLVRITSGGARNIGFYYGLGALIMLKKFLQVNP